MTNNMNDKELLAAYEAQREKTWAVRRRAWTFEATPAEYKNEATKLSKLRQSAIHRGLITCFTF